MYYLTLSTQNKNSLADVFQFTQLLGFACFQSLFFYLLFFFIVLLVCQLSLFCLLYIALFAYYILLTIHCFVFIVLLTIYCFQLCVDSRNVYERYQRVSRLSWCRHTHRLMRAFQNSPTCTFKPHSCPYSTIFPLNANPQVAKIHHWTY